MRRQSAARAITTAFDEMTLRRYRRLRRLPGSWWQGAIVEYPFVSEDPATGAPRRVRGVIWVAENPPGVASRLVDQTPGLPEADVCALTLLDLAFDRGREAPKGRPAVIEVTDETLGRSVVERIGDQDVTVRVVERLEQIELALRLMAESLPSADIPAALDAPGVTVDRLAAYADAARAFHRAAPWEHLTSADLLAIESPVPDASLSHVVVTGNGGVRFGLAFFESPEHHDHTFGQGIDRSDMASPLVLGGGADGIGPDDLEHDLGPASGDDVGADLNGNDLDDAEPGDDDSDDTGLEDDDREADWEDSLDEDEDTSAEDEGGWPNGIWSLTFEPRPVLPRKDVEAWIDHDLPYDGPRSHPLMVRFWNDGRVDRPDAACLAFLEGVLRAIAATTEEEIDTGRWQKTVVTFDGAAEYRFALPTVLEVDQPTLRRPVPRRPLDRRALERVQAEVGRFLATNRFGSIEAINEAVRARFTGPMDAIASTAVTPLERAQDLCYQAVEARGRGRVVLARRAIALSRDCADAWVLLAERESRAERALELYREGVAAGERALGGEWADGSDHHDWGDLRARPYMRARFGAASVLELLDRPDEAAAEYRALLRLNPSDNQGARYALFDILLAAGRDDEARDLLAQYEDDVAASWLWGRALLEYRLQPDGPAAREAIVDAIEANPRVLAFFEDPDALDRPVPEQLEIGGPSDALDAAERLYDAWAATPGAIDWAFAVAAAMEEERRRPSRRAKGKARKKRQIARQSRRRNRRGRS